MPVNSEEMLIENELSRFGLRTIHVMRMGGPVNVERWLELSPVVCRDAVQCYRSVEKELGVHHLFLFWPTREITRFKYSTGQIQDGVMWWIGKSWYETEKTASIREAADWATMTYQMAFLRSPTRCLVGKILEGWNMKSGSCFEIEGDPDKNIGTGGQAIKLELVEEPWIPRGFLVIT